MRGIGIVAVTIFAIPETWLIIGAVCVVAALVLLWCCLMMADRG